MNKLIEELMMTRTPVHPKCQGVGFTAAEKPFLSAARCKHIEPVEIYEQLDEETGEVDPETEPELSVEDPACRCAVYWKPESFWRRGRCPMASHFDPFVEPVAAKTRVGQQKQKKKR
jgi:hypothetical protein